MKHPLTTTRPEGAPSLPELRATLEASLTAYPELRRELRMALTGVERRLGIPSVTGAQQHNRGRDGLR